MASLNYREKACYTQAYVENVNPFRQVRSQVRPRFGMSGTATAAVLAPILSINGAFRWVCLGTGAGVGQRDVFIVLLEP